MWRVGGGSKHITTVALRAMCSWFSDSLELLVGVGCPPRDRGREERERRGREIERREREEGERLREREERERRGRKRSFSDCLSLCCTLQMSRCSRL